MTQETDIIKSNKILDNSKREMDIILDRWFWNKVDIKWKKNHKKLTQYIIDLNVKVETNFQKKTVGKPFVTLGQAKILLIGHSTYEKGKYCEIHQN